VDLLVGHHAPLMAMPDRGQLQLNERRAAFLVGVHDLPPGVIGAGQILPHE